MGTIEKGSQLAKVIEVNTFTEILGCLDCIERALRKCDVINDSETKINLDDLRYEITEYKEAAEKAIKEMVDAL
jgi:hypothetical protein